MVRVIGFFWMLCAIWLLTIASSSAQTELQIENLGGRTIQLSWPDDGTGLRLEDSADLRDFRAVPDVPTLIESRYSLIVPAIEEARFFRLRESRKLTLAINEGAVIQAGEEMVLTPAMLSVSDPVTPPDEIV